ncbi:MAG: ribonuclease H-like domain-containing protein [Candidatus Micrarchaeota archaeon]|nr:ribonuclease H-like domain-containing protein [Candidatus Micrarchaeota archaeon]
MSKERKSAGSVDDDSLVELEAAVLDVDYINQDERSTIRMTVKSADGTVNELLDTSYRPYFYFVPIGKNDISGAFAQDGENIIKPTLIEKAGKTLLGKKVEAFKVYVVNTAQVPKLSDAMRHLGDAYEKDIPFAKRYAIDNSITPLIMQRITASRGEDGRLILRSMEPTSTKTMVELSVMCFDIEVYSPSGGMPKAEKDPIIMISYSFKGKEKKSGVITFKKIDLPFVEAMPDEKGMITRFMDLLNELQPDIVTGYNSSGFDVKYFIDRCGALNMKFSMSRFEGSTKLENHGLVTRVKVAGRVHVDMYSVIKFISVVGAAESILKLNSKTLKNVYEAIAGDSKKVMVDKPNIWKMWDGGREELEQLATYNLDDSFALEKVYETFIPIMIELARLTYDPLTDVCVSTTGQLVEFMMMHSSCHNNELIPNKPDDRESRDRLRNPIEGAYVKTPEPGVYDNLVMFDFRGLYPSIIISYNIDPSTVTKEGTGVFESPEGTRFLKSPKGIMPGLLKMLMDQRAEVKKAYKKDPKNIFLGSRSMALKIVSNSFYGYLGYARSRWYSRPCASSVTAFGRQYINDVMSKADARGMKVLYGDTDSLVMLMGDKTKDDAMSFMKEYNSKLPPPMELELEDFYSRGVFVGKKVAKESEAAGAKKKYALLSESGRVKIRGFELVRRDWSRVSRDTQRAVLETILKEGDPKKASDIVKETIRRLRDGEVPLSDVVISTQLRKGIEGYEVKSPEVSAAKKAVQAGFKTRDEVENNTIGYIVTKHGSSISDKAEMEGMAKDYDPEYYINHQVIPATMKILKELGFSEEELKGLGTQKKLG